MNIRRYEKGDDLEGLVEEVLKGIEPEHYSEEEQAHLEKVIPEMTMDFVAEDRYVYFVAVEDGELVGASGLQKESGTIGGMFVDPDRQGEGIGSALLERVEEKAREEGLETLTSPASLEAVGFYEKNGYTRKEKESPDMYGMEVPVLNMEKKL